MPEHVARSHPGRIETSVVAFPNYSLEDHWNVGEARRAIQRAGRDFVVPEPGPSTLAGSQRLAGRSDIGRPSPIPAVDPIALRALQEVAEEACAEASRTSP